MLGPTDEIPAIVANREELLTLLKADAEYFQPRLFAIYGIRNSIDTSQPGAPYLGWGLDLHGDDGVVVFVDPRDGGTHCSESTERLLTLYQRLGEAHLVWLD